MFPGNPYPRRDSCEKEENMGASPCRRTGRRCQRSVWRRRRNDPGSSADWYDRTGRGCDFPGIHPHYTAYLCRQLDLLPFRTALGQSISIPGWRMYRWTRSRTVGTKDSRSLAPQDLGWPDHMGRNSYTMVIGILLGFLSGLGVGGGSLLILWLALVLGMDQSTARTINLMFFIPCALSSLLVRKTGTASRKRLLPAIAAGCAAAWFCSRLNMNLPVLQKCFGILLVATGIRELCYKSKKTGSVTD